MTYADLLESENVYSQYLVIMRPRRMVTSASFVAVTGSIYSQSFDYGHVSNVFADGVSLTENADSSVASGEWFFDFDTNTIYVNTGGSPAAVQFVLEYELYFGTFDAHWYRSPLDNTSRVVYYE